MGTTPSTSSAKVDLSSALLGMFCNSTSTAMRTLERAVAEVAPTDLPIFIVGESGTGKGTLATMIHRLSKRSDHGLVKVNCCRLPLNFASKENSGPSALDLTARQLQGSLLLDEVLELPPVWEPQVMAILPEGDIEPCQSRMAPRVIAATRSDHWKPLSGSPLSRELYYRLRGVLLRIPPLRERREDIPLLSHFLLNKYADSFGRTGVGLSARAEEKFQRHSWPGNVRELENAIKTLLAIDDEDLVLEVIGFSGTKAGTNGNREQIAALESRLSLKETGRIASRIAEKQLISEVLGRTGWNRKRAAKELNISYKALLYKVKQNGLSSPRAPGVEPFRRGTD